MKAAHVVVFILSAGACLGQGYSSRAVRGAGSVTHVGGGPTWVQVNPDAGLVTRPKPPPTVNAFEPAESAFQSVSGKVLQVMPGRTGMMVDAGNDRTVFVKPATKSAYEGSRVIVAAIRTEDYEYVTVLGAPKVIPGYRIPSPDEVDADDKRRAKLDAENSAKFQESVKARDEKLKVREDAKRKQAEKATAELRARSEAELKSFTNSVVAPK